MALAARRGSCLSRWRSLAWMLAGMLQPLQQRPVALAHEHLGPAGRCSLLRAAQTDLQRLLLVQHRPGQAIAPGLLWGPCVRAAAS